MNNVVSIISIEDFHIREVHTPTVASLPQSILSARRFALAITEGGFAPTTLMGGREESRGLGLPRLLTRQNASTAAIIKAVVC